MERRTRALVVDFGIAGGATALSLVGVGGDPLVSVAIVAVGAVLTVSAGYLTEHGSVLAAVDARRPLSWLVVAAAVLLAALVVVLGRAAVASPAAMLLLGNGLGLAGYRFVYGVVKPLPEKRCRQAGLWEPDDAVGNPP